MPYVRGVRRLAGSGTGLPVVKPWRTGQVAQATAAKGMLQTFQFISVSIYFSNKRKSGSHADLTYYTSVAGIVDGVDRFAVIGTTTAERARGGHAETGVVSKYGFARGRANVSSPATSGGNELMGAKLSGQGRGSGSGEEVLTKSGSPAGTGSLPRVSE